MSDAVYAAALGLAIPVIGISVCRRLWRNGRAVAMGRKSRDGGILTIGFAIQVSVLLAACYGFNHVASSMKTEPGHFDPYEILQLSSRSSNASVIKSQYRRLSLKYHPDKNPGNRKVAAAQFNRVAKAYKALSDPEARRNWELHGHPDGYQPWSFDLALPSWLRPGRDSSNTTLALYTLGYLVLLVSFVLSAKVGLNMLDPTEGWKQPMLKVTEEDVKALLNSLDDTSSIEDVFECLAACPQLCSEERRELADNMEPITKPIHKRLAARGAGPLRSSPAPSSTSRKASRSGKSKGSSKAKHANSGGNRHDKVDGEQQAVQGDGVEEEFYSRGRRGEGNRRTTRSQPELSNVVTHNLVVLMSALFHERVSSGDGVAGEDGNASEEGDTSAATTSSTVERDGEGGADIRSASALGADEVKGNVGDSAIDDAGGSGHGAIDPSRDTGMNQVAPSEQLVGEQEVLFGLAEPLLDACLTVAAKRASPRLFGTVVDAKAMLRRRLWSSDDPDALREQEREADVDLDAAVPRIKVEKMVVETWGESQVAVGDTVTATITIAREHASQYRGFRRRRPVDGFMVRGEPWWVILAGGKGGEALIAVTPMLVENLASEVAECKVKFQAPRRHGILHLTATVKSPIFVGVDCEGSTSLRVYRRDELKDDDEAGDW